MRTFARTPGTLDLVDEFGNVHDLNDIMDFDHVIQVHADGTLTEPRGIYAPDVYVDDSVEPRNLWTLLKGFSGQHGYGGPIMHPSEFMGGGLAQHVLDTPGRYVITEVRDVDASLPDEPIGWVVAYRA